MEIQEQANLSFKGVDIVDVKFQAIRPRGENMSINVECFPVAIIPKGKKDRFSIAMDVQVSCEGYFMLNLRAIGGFALNTDINDNIKKTFINVNAVAIMFPYIRSFIATFTANIGNATGTLNIPTQFFEGELKIIDKNKED